MVLAHNINEGLRTQDVQISEDVTFNTMLLTPNTMKGLTNSGFYKPSPIQLHGIPLGKCGFDLLLEAKSGTGKTVVFTVIALEKLDLMKGLQTVILTPTREIAAQISNVIKEIGCNYNSLTVEVVIGGLPTHEDIAKFKKKVHIVVGSPGRLRHLIQAKHIDVSAVRLLVLDEADKLMDKSFQADINYIFSVLPYEKQVILSSATFPETLKSAMKKYVQNAQRICPDSTTILLGIKQFVVTVKNNSNIVRITQNRFEELLKILSKKQFRQCLIFCNYQARVRDLCKMLMHKKWHAKQLHGQQEQTVRLDALRTLQEYKCRILVSTDLAARGIDASNVDLVINFEPPYEWQTYLHRIGRAGRFGSRGIAVTILSEGHEESKFQEMIKAISSSLNLRNLWDEDKFDGDESLSDYSLSDYTSSDTSPVPEVQVSELHTELINVLTYGEVDNETELSDTCESLDRSKKKEIKSFQDLMTCFESQKVSNLDNHDSPSENNLPATCTNEQTGEHGSQLDTNTEIKENVTILREEQIEEEDLSNTNKKQKNKLKKCKTGIKVTQSLKQDIYNNRLSDLESEMHKALLEAGLPTSFGSSKYNKRRSNNIHSTGLNDANVYNNTQELRCNKQNRIDNDITHVAHKFDGTKRNTVMNNNVCTSAGSKTSRKLKTEQRTPCNSECTSYSSNKQTNSKQLQAHLYKKEHNNYRRDYNQNIYAASKNYEREIKNDIHTKYEIWYNQLKTHMEQVQMSLYIKEMSIM